MSTQRMIVTLAGMTVLVIGGLVYLAMGGSTYATSILFAVWSIFCLVLGWLLSYLQVRSQAEREQASFMANAKENLAIMQGLQRSQNLQNRTLMDQLKGAARLPEPAGGAEAGLELIDGIFEELE